MSKKHKGPEVPVDHPEAAIEMEELKRDVQSAQIAAFLHKYQQHLTIAAVLILLAATGASLWTENQHSQKEAAASLYYQALSQQDSEKKIAALSDVSKDYGSTAYALLSRLQLAALSEEPEEAYRNLIDDQNFPQVFRWQAQLDLAEYFVDHSRVDEARPLLETRTGKQFEQLRYFLLSQISTGSEQQDYLRKALDAKSNDQLLKEKIESLLAKAAATNE